MREQLKGMESLIFLENKNGFARKKVLRYF